MAEVRYIGQIKQLTHRSSEKLEVDTILQMLKKIESNYGTEAYLMAKKSHIAVNNTSITMLEGFRSKLEDDDVVHIIPVCGGG